MTAGTSVTHQRRRAGIEAYPLSLWSLLILYRRDRDQAFSLNASAQAVWQLCDGRSSISQISGELERLLGITEPGALHAEVEAAVGALTKSGLLERA